MSLLGEGECENDCVHRLGSAGEHEVKHLATQTFNAEKDEDTLLTWNFLEFSDARTVSVIH